MKESVKRMDDIINSLVSWLNDYPRHLLTTTQKQRVTHILDKLSKDEAIDLDKLNQDVSKEYDRSKGIPIPNLPAYADKFNYFICDGCSTRVLKENKNKHRKECAKWKQIHKTKFSKKIKITSFSKGSSITNDLPGKTYNKTDNDLKNQDLSNREQDGSRDYYQIRDNGKFGSMSSFEDYGDESNP